MKEIQNFFVEVVGEPKTCKTLIVLGNGPSAKDFDWDLLIEHDAIGMNGAYRWWRKIDRWPLYHCCFDKLVTKNHKTEFRQLMENSPITIFFMMLPISDSKKLVVLNPEKLGFGMTFRTFKYGGGTGSNACQVGMCLGYKKLILIGCDCEYVQQVEGSKREGDHLVMIETPSGNPNYFWSEYQQKGDKFNIPREETYHLPYWRMLAKFALANGVDIVNCGGEQSKIECFRRGILQQELEG